MYSDDVAHEDRGKTSRMKKGDKRGVAEAEDIGEQRLSLDLFLIDCGVGTNTGLRNT